MLYKSRYVTKSRLIEEGIDIASNSRLYRLIEEVGQTIERRLFMIFYPLSEKALSRGGMNAIDHKNWYPILKLDGVTNHDGETIDSDRYIVKQWRLEMLNRLKKFPVHTYIDGTFGWLEDAKNIETVTKAELNSLTTTLELDSVAGIRERDTVDIIGDDYEYRVTVNSVNYQTKIISFDAIYQFEGNLPIGAYVKAWGNVPLLIERAAIMLVKKREMPIASEDFDDQLIEGNIKKEKTDNYSYELFDADQGGGISDFTGDTSLDYELFTTFGSVHAGVVV